MLKSISRSTTIMFFFDLLTLLCVTNFVWDFFISGHNILKIFIVGSVVILGLFSLFLKGQYKIREHNITTWNAYRLFEGVIIAHFPAIIILCFFLSQSTLLFLVSNILVIYILFCIYRSFYHYYLFYLKPTKNILILGSDINAKILTDEIINKKALKMKVIGFFKDKYSEKDYLEDDKYKIFEDFSNIGKVIQDNKVKIVVVAIKRRMEEELLSQLVSAIPNNVKVYKMAEFYEMVTSKCYIDRMTTNWLFYSYMKHRSSAYDFCKRIFDVISASTILAVTFPVLLFIAIKVKLTDGGSPIYSQTRVGKDGKPFECYKLRTMYMNDYIPTKNNMTKGEGINDDRVIPFCKWVRKARLDEIPQMVNILKGEMSIVGPRTEWSELVNIYSKEINYYKCRQWIKTGWTGWAQINQGHCVTNDDVFEKLTYDLFYLKHRNIFWDISILIKAIFLAIGGRHD